MGRADTYLTALLVAVIGGMIAAVLLSIECGYRMGIRLRSRNPRRFQSLHPTIDASIFGLMGLLIAFTFSGAGTRFDNRRNVVVQEANAIGTAYLRLDLLPPETRPELREEFRAYVRSRMAVNDAIPDMSAVHSALDRSTILQGTLWEKVVDASRNVGAAEKSLVLSSLNELIDITTVSTATALTHPPFAVFAMLGLTVIVSSVIAGYEMAGSGVRNWVSTISFALLLGSALYMILDYEFPRIGFIRVDSVDQFLVDELSQMK